MKSMGKIMQVLLVVIVALTAGWLLSAGWGGYVDPRRWVVPAFASISYPVALIVAVVVAVICLMVKRWKYAVAMLLVVLATWPALHVNVPLNFFPASVSDTTATFTVLTYNVAGFYEQTADQPGATMRYILDSGADMVMLQEAALGPKDFVDADGNAPLRDEINRKYPYHSHGYHDLIILSRYPYSVYADTTLRHGFGALDDIRSEYHFYAKAFDIQISGRQLRIINVHMQSIGLNESDKKLYEDMGNLKNARSNVHKAQEVKASLLNKLARAYRRRAGEAHLLRDILDQSPANVIVCGDFNDTPASYSYWTVRGDDLHDAFAECGLGLINTFNAHHMPFNIDHMLYRGHMRATTMRRDKAGLSDHYPQIATFEWTTASSKP